MFNWVLYRPLKTTQHIQCLKLAFFVTVHFNYFHDTNLNRLHLGVTQKQELHVSFKPTTLLNLYSKMDISWEILEKANSDISLHYRSVVRIHSKIYDGPFGRKQLNQKALSYLLWISLKWSSVSVLSWVNGGKLKK